MRNCIFLFLFLLLPVISFAQTADEMAKELENLYSRGAGTSMSLVIDGAKNTVTFATNSAKFRIDNPTDLFVSDGANIWHYMKTKKEVVIDKAGAKGMSSNIQDIMKFSTNYSSVLTKKKSGYELALTPSQSMSKILEGFGGISRMTFTFFWTKKNGIAIKKITTRAASGEISAANVKMQPLKKLDEKLFTFTAPKGAKVTDLRD
jgi:outer membrane lipoprotein-sorting protein